jgi:hypothetical protein
VAYSSGHATIGALLMLFFWLPLMERSRYATQTSSLRLRSKKRRTWSVLNIRLGRSSKTTITVLDVADDLD